LKGENNSFKKILNEDIEFLKMMNQKQDSIMSELKTIGNTRENKPNFVNIENMQTIIDLIKVFFFFF